mmetsp:Transcript_123264/g.343798  ORF Transcript_123264/g.343798 Transcript_123264/m.343798 type:complete len:232 (-) Transcript_123264:71-766(-)
MGALRAERGDGGDRKTRRASASRCQMPPVSAATTNIASSTSPKFKARLWLTKQTQRLTIRTHAMLGSSGAAALCRRASRSSRRHTGHESARRSHWRRHPGQKLWPQAVSVGASPPALSKQIAQQGPSAGAAVRAATSVSDDGLPRRSAEAPVFAKAPRRTPPGQRSRTAASSAAARARKPRRNHRRPNAAQWGPRAHSEATDAGTARPSPEHKQETATCSGGACRNASARH